MGTSRWRSLAWAVGLAAGLLWTAAAAATEPPATPGTWTLDARADQVLGRMGQAEGDARRLLTVARGAGDEARARCVAGKLTDIQTNLTQARRTRASLRTAMIHDHTAAVDAAWKALGQLELAARDLASQASACQASTTEVGYDRDADGIPDQLDKAPEDKDGIDDQDGSPEPAIPAKPPVIKLHELETKIDALKDKVWSSKSALMRNTGTPSLPPSAAAIAAPGPHDTTKIIRTAELTLAVVHVDRGLASVDAIARDIGGYLSLRTDQQVTVRVPRERFDEAMRRIEQLGDVLHRSVTAEDVTDEYVDLDMRLRNALVVRARLEKLLETAAVRDAVEIEKELARVTEEIERIEGKLKLLGDRIAYSSITVSFEPSPPQQIRNRALLPFPWMNDVGLSPLLALPGGRK
jgi:hypothetical protein